MAGQNADMTLKVGLDLNFFRQELQKASSTLAGQPIDINVRFNKKGIADQYRLLTRYLGGKKSFDVKIESNTLNALTDKVANFQKTLKALKDEKVELSINASANIEKFSKEKIRKIRAQIRRDIVSGGAGEIQLPTKLATPNVAAFVKGLAKQAQVTVSIKNGATGKEARSVLDAIESRIQTDQKIKQGGGKLRVPTSIKASINNADVSDFKKAVNEKLGSIAIKIKAEVDIAKTPAQIQAEVARKMEDIARIGAERMAGGGVTEAARREQFRAAITGEGIGSLKNIAGQVGVKGAYKYKSETATALIDKLVQEASIEAITKYLDPQAVMKNPDRSGLNRVLDTFARGLLQMLGMDPAALKAAKVQTIQSAAQTMQVARSSSGGLPAGVAGLLPSVTQRTAISQGVQGIYRGLSGQVGEEGPGGALVDVRRIYAALERNLRKIFEVVEVDVQETSMGIKDAMGAFAYLAQALQDAEARTKKAQIGNAVKSLLEKVTGALKAAEAQAVIPVSVRDVTLRPQEPQFRPGSRVPLTMAPQRTLPAAGETTANINRMRIRTGYNVPAPIEANPFYAAPTVPRSRPPYTGAVKTATPRRTPGGFIGVGEAAGGGLEEAAFVNAAKNALRFNEALNISKKSLDGFRASQLPLVGGLRELGSEFGFALKQVLLFGTAYKGLAFVQSLPGQILNAAKSQQQYNNALQTATQDTGTFAKELVYVDNVQRAFGLNLQTTRDGFTKLYASMAPTGFDSGSIEKLFTGISAATAALQLTPDKAERVIYAFGQMASKGQIMSEELKGQLGDVLPGALAIFAKAAGMSVKEFSKAMEDGEFVGQKFRDTFAKVSDELMTRFGTGAQAAGKSLQGLLNTVQGDFARTLESFAPLADAAAQAILGPLGGSLKQLSQSAKIATGEIERTYSQLKAAQQDVSDLRAGGADAKEIKAAEQNVAALAARYTALMRAARDPAIAKQAQDIQKFTEELTKAGTFVMNMAKAIGSVLSPVLNLLGGNLTTVISLLTSFYVGFQTARLAAMALMGALSLYKGLTALLGFGTAAAQATALAGALNVLGVATTGAQVKIVGLRVALTALVATTVIGAVVGGITLIAGAFATMRDRAKEAADESRNAVAEGARAATMGEVMTVTTQLNQELAKNRAVSEGYKTLEKIYLMNKEIMKQGGRPLISVKDMATLKEAEKYSREIAGIISGNQMKRGGFEIQAFRGQELGRAKQEAGQVSAEVRKSTTILKQQEQDALRRQKQIGLNQPTPSTIVETEPPDEKALKAQQTAAEEARKLADDKRKYEADLMKLSSQQAIDLNEMEFDQWKNLQQAKYDFLEAGQNDWMSREIKFQRDLQAIEIRRIEAIRRARIETVKAETEAQSRAYVAGGAGIGATTGLMQGSTGVSSGPHFDVRRADGSRISEAEARALFDPAVRRQLQMTSGYGPRNAGIPGASTFHRGIDLAGPANTPLNLAPGYSMQSAGMEGGLGYTANVRGPQGQMYKVGHLQEPKSGMPASRVRAEAKKDYSAALASQEAINAKEKENAQIKYANIQAQQELNVLIRDYTASIVPIEQQRLENTLLQNRIDLMTSGLFGEALDAEQKISETREKAALGVQMANDAIAANNKLVKDGILTQEQADRLNASNVEKIKQLTEGLQNYIPLLRERLKLEQSSAEASLMGQIRQESPLGGMGLSAGFIGPAADKYVEAIGRGAPEEEASRFAELQNQLTLLETRNEAIKQSIYGIGDAFGEAMTTGVTGLISGTATAKEVFASFLQSVGQALSQAASQMIATYIAIGIAKLFAGLGGGGGNPAGSGGGISDSLPGIRQYAGGMGGAGAPGSMPFAPPAFANGGIVTGPTLSLIGEGRYNEAVVPLPNGRAIPVQINGSRSARDLMGSNAPGMANAAPLTLKFESTKINGVEYVSREQLELAMAETRRASIAGGATRGMNMALDKIQQSPSTRSRIGIR